MKPGNIISSFIFICYFTTQVAAAQVSNDSILSTATLQQCVQYAIERQPVVRQARIDEEITENNIKSRLADWFPQVNFNYTFQHNFQVPVAMIGGNPVRLGVENTSGLSFLANQTIFNRDVLLASRSRADVRTQAKQNTESSKIDVAVNVSRAFYDLLATEQQIRVMTENIARLEKSYKDAYSQYQAGITDKTDYKRASIALNNVLASKKSFEALAAARLVALKSAMNYPAGEPLNIVYDSLQMEQEIVLDTLRGPDYRNRIEFRLLETQMSLQQANVDYNRWAYLPTVSANGAYNMNYLNNEFTKLYARTFPASYAGLTLSFPIFQGGKRKYDISAAKWQLRRTEQDIVSLKNGVNREYNMAMANYKSNLASYEALKANLELAREVYDITQLQYKSGIKTYLEVIISETDLRTAQINYYDALYALLSSKIDVQRSLGEIKW
ncbi:MAG: TolC family protein [Chitinophagaceae bacterium]|nr:TolC family protein [Chitinophagaceae bacterium]MCW5927953.1 TolC family protein [Chitinophagaceae bacterium]